MNVSTETFPTTATAYQDHAAYGVYSGSAFSETGADDGLWHVTLRHGRGATPAEMDQDTVVHTRTVASRRHAEHLLDAWTDARQGPEPLEVGEVTRPQPYTEAQRHAPYHLDAEWRDDTEALALRLATSRTGAHFGEARSLALLVCELGAEREALQAKVDAFLVQWDRPDVSLRGWGADLDQAVQALRGEA